MAQSIGAVLKAARERAGMTQSHVARAAGISPNIVSRLEAGERLTPTFATVARLAAALGLSLDTIASAIGLAPALPGSDPTLTAELQDVRRILATADAQLDRTLARLTKPAKRGRK